MNALRYARVDWPVAYRAIAESDDANDAWLDSWSERDRLALLELEVAAALLFPGPEETAPLAERARTWCTRIGRCTSRLRPESTRFSDGSWRVRTLASTPIAAIVELLYRRCEFLRDSGLESQQWTVTVEVHRPPENAHRIDPADFVAHADSWSGTHAIARHLRASGSPAVMYPSMIDGGGDCVAEFRPPSHALPFARFQVWVSCDGGGSADAAVMRSDVRMQRPEQDD
jgi:hypothetical protein